MGKGGRYKRKGTPDLYVLCKKLKNKVSKLGNEHVCYKRKQNKSISFLNSRKEFSAGKRS